MILMKKIEKWFDSYFVNDSNFDFYTNDIFWWEQKTPQTMPEIKTKFNITVCLHNSHPYPHRQDNSFTLEGTKTNRNTMNLWH